MAHEKNIFTPLKIKSIEFRNRLWVSPMCQYSSRDGHPTDWHFVHLGSRAVGGAGLVMVEATAVSPEGRISPDDSGIWSDEHVLSFKRITDFVRAQGAVAGVQLAHAGRKGSTSLPWDGDRVLGPSERGWETLAPTAIPFREGDPLPREMTKDDLVKTVRDFENAAVRALNAGFQVIELHFAHGYLINEFLSPLSNRRTDEYGGTLENRMRFPLEVARAVRKKWPMDLPLFVRISATDWVDGPAELESIARKEYGSSGGWNLAGSVALAKELKKVGVDLIDCSTGGTLSKAEIPSGPNYQVPFAEVIRREAEILAAAVGMITDPAQAEGILVQHQADAIFLAREFLRDPYFPARAAKELGSDLHRPKQYSRA